MAKPDRVECNLHSAKHDIIKRRSQFKSNTDRWCCLIEHDFDFCTDAHSCTLRCQSLPDRWTDCRSNAAGAISRLCSDSYTGRRCYVIEHSYFDSCTNNRCHAIDYTRYYSATSHYNADSCTVERNRHFGCCIVERSRYFDSCIERRCFSVSRRWQLDADSFTDSDCTVERYRELPADDCANRR